MAGIATTTPVQNNGTSAFCDSGQLNTDDGLPLSGNIQVTLFPNGDYFFKTHAHDAGFTHLNYNIVAVLTSASGRPFSFQHDGSMQGTIDAPFGNPRRDDDFTSPTLNDARVRDNFQDMAGGKLIAVIDGSDATLSGILDVLKNAAGTVGIALLGAIATLGGKALVGGPQKPAPSGA